MSYVTINKYILYDKSDMCSLFSDRCRPVCRVDGGQ